MGSLFQRIARELGDRVEAYIHLDNLFEAPPAQAIAMIKTAKHVLEQWFVVYMQVRWGPLSCSCELRCKP